MLWKWLPVSTRNMRIAYKFIFGLLLCAQVVCANDHIFPAAPAARSFIDFDPNGFIVNGKRTFLVSAGLEYARIPRDLWADRLLRLQRGGFNCVEIYTFWNYHEPFEGVFNFSGEHDLDAFLKLVKKMGMYAIVRVGPYYCAEWDFGGYPLWLKFKRGLEVRKPNAVFEEAVGRFFDRLVPIVAANQIHHDGPVILVQLENEHPQGWGTTEPNQYFTFLREKAVSLGIEVPYFFSGLHHANDPVGNTASLIDASRPNPWFSTEFWSVWYNGYSSGEKEAKVYEDRTWKIIERGGGGYNYYMAHGGSNFGFTNNDEDAASYDYGAAVGQAGDLRPIYYSFKRMGLFAQSFAAELAAHVVRFSDSSVVVGNWEVSGGRMLARVVQKKDTTLVVYGAVGSRLSLRFGSSVLNAVVPSGREPLVVSAGRRLRVLVMNVSTADRSWVIPYDGLDYIVCGPRYVGPIFVREGRVSMVTEDTVGALVYSAGKVQRLRGRVAGVGLPGAGVVGSWVRQAATGEAAVNYDDQYWKMGEWPLQMGADGDTTADAWYRTRVVVDTAGSYTLLVDGADRGSFFLDGKPLGPVDIKNGAVPLELTAGKHLVAAFIAHDGRDKLPDYLGPMDIVAQKGLFGRALLVKGAPAVKTLTEWRVLKNNDSTRLPSLDDAGWKSYKIGDDVFDKKQGFAWFETVLSSLPAGAAEGELRFASVDENATVFINGRRLMRHEGWNKPFNVGIDGLDTMQRPIRVLILIENYSNEGGIDQAVRFSPWVAPVEVKKWRMKGGMGEAVVDSVAAGSVTVAGPCWWKTEFTVPANPHGITIWRVIPEGLGHGSVWVNGHNLGRYPEKIPVNGLYIPECWLVNGRNSLTIFDEDGRDASRVRVEAEVAASRPLSLLQ